MIARVLLARGTKYIFALVPVPKSKIRDHVEIASSFTHAAMEIAPVILRVELGFTRKCGLAPDDVVAKKRPWPMRPITVAVDVDVKLLEVALLPLPETSLNVLPISLPSNVQWATSPEPASIALLGLGLGGGLLGKRLIKKQ